MTQRAPVIIRFRCHGWSLNGSTLQWLCYWPISRSHRSRNAHVIGVKVPPWSRRQSEFFVPRSIVVSAMVVFSLVDTVMLSRLQIVHWRNYKLKPFANSNRDTRTAPVWSKTNKIAGSSWWDSFQIIISSVPDHTATVTHMELHILTVSYEWQLCAFLPPGDATCVSYQDISLSFCAAQTIASWMSSKTGTPSRLARSARYVRARL